MQSGLPADAASLRETGSVDRYTPRGPRHYVCALCISETASRAIGRGRSCSLDVTSLFWHPLARILDSLPYLKLVIRGQEVFQFRLIAAA